MAVPKLVIPEDIKAGTAHRSNPLQLAIEVFLAVNVTKLSCPG